MASLPPPLYTGLGTWYMGTVIIEGSRAVNETGAGTEDRSLLYRNSNEVDEPSRAIKGMSSVPGRVLVCCLMAGR